MKIIQKNEDFYLVIENTEILRFKNLNDDMQIEVINPILEISENDFKELVGKSPLRNYDLFCKISEFNEGDISFLNQLGFSFYGVEHMPENNEIYEVYHFKYKEEFFINKNELEDILKKLDL